MNAMPEEYRRRLSLSNLWDGCDIPPLLEGIIFLKKMLELTKTRADPKAQRRPIALEADMSKEHASMTPMVSGRREMYVLDE
jgi:hypothetical protein